MKKTTLLIGGVLAGSLLLTGCASGSSYTRPAPEDTYVAPEPEPVYTDEDYFVAEIRYSGNSYAANPSDSDLIDVGRQTCSLLDDGYTVMEIATYLVENGDSNDPEFYEFEGIVVGSAVRNLCPEYTYQIP